MLAKLGYIMYIFQKNQYGNERGRSFPYWKSSATVRIYCYN